MLHLTWSPAPTADNPLSYRQALLAIIGLSLLSWALFIALGVWLTAFLTNAGSV